MNQQIVIADSSALSIFDACPVQWYYMRQEQISKIPTREPDPNKLNYREMGSAIHKILEFRYRDKLPMSKCVENGFEWSQADPKQRLTELELIQVRWTALAYDAVYGQQGDFIISSPETVEVGFSEVIYEDAQYKFILEGRIDLVNAGFANGMTAIVDHKGQGKTTPLYKKSIQFRNYALVTGASMLVINYIRFNKNITKDTFVRDIATFTPMDHAAWRIELINLFRRIASFKQNLEEHHAPDVMIAMKHRSQCSGSFGTPCEFIDLCDSTNFSILHSIKEQNYAHKEPYKPW